jgi:hypothetical protein
MSFAEPNDSLSRPRRDFLKGLMAGASASVVGPALQGSQAEGHPAEDCEVGDPSIAERRADGPPGDGPPGDHDPDDFDPDVQGGHRLFIRKAVPHRLEILTRAEWEGLGPEKYPDTFTMYSEDLYFRVRDESLAERAEQDEDEVEG